jgi:hypothetical protein
MNYDHIEMLRKPANNWDMLDAVIQRDTPYSLDWMAKRIAQDAETRSDREEIIDDVLSEVDDTLDWVAVYVNDSAEAATGHRLEVAEYAVWDWSVDISRRLEGTYLDPESDEEDTGATIETDETDMTDTTDGTEDTHGHGMSRSAMVAFLQAKMEQSGAHDTERYTVTAGPCPHTQAEIEDSWTGSTKLGERARRRLSGPLRRALKTLRGLGVVTDEGTPACSECKYTSTVGRAAGLVGDGLPVAGIVFIPVAPVMPRTLLYRRPETLSQDAAPDDDEFRAGLPIEAVGQLVETVLDLEDSIEYRHDEHKHVVTITDYGELNHSLPRHFADPTVVEPCEIGEEHDVRPSMLDVTATDAKPTAGLTEGGYRRSPTAVSVNGTNTDLSVEDVSFDEVVEGTMGGFGDSLIDSLDDMDEMLAETRKQVQDVDLPIKVRAEDESGSAGGEAEE